MDKKAIIEYTTANELRGIHFYRRITRIVGFLTVLRPITIENSSRRYLAVCLSTSRGLMANVVAFNNDIKKFINSLKLDRILMTENVVAIPPFESIRHNQIYQLAFDIGLDKDSTIVDFGPIENTMDIKLTFEPE